MQVMVHACGDGNGCENRKPIDIVLGSWSQDRQQGLKVEGEEAGTLQQTPSVYRGFQDT